MIYYLISYGYHYGNSGSATHHTCVTRQAPVEFIKEKIVQGMKEEPSHNQFHIIFSMEITEKEYYDFMKSH